MSVPVVVVVQGFDKLKISKVSGWDTTTIVFYVDEDFVEYKVCVVPSYGALHGSGITIPTVGGSVNTSGVGSFYINTNITCTVNGTDLESASSGDGTKLIKIFAKGTSGNWSV